ncbi:hypothetical protein JRO89_XS03G0143700 [Xanthoceras sorbifolium]|uniref:F-box domain-containing protein n=1 Tax=Xanthoceras sorbifolium TaxID=99658 RepID=A0ABQ8I9T8_9ROSI|nr:hypothetical protein JRO89_XS03G0143700 [Xanthoceras sorbifolium]
MMMEAEQKQQQQEEEEGDRCLIPGLPDEIAMECLIRVPHEFHSNMKSVCLNWQNLISNPSFYQERVKANTAEQLVFQVQPLPKQSSTHMMMIHDRALITSNKKEEADDQNQTQQEQTHHSPPQYGLTIYNATYHTWQRMNPNFAIPMFCQCVALQSSGKLLLLGGWDPKTLEPVSDVYVLDIIKGSSSWSKGASMSVARSFFACAVVGGSKVYVAGGHDNQKNGLKSAEVYDVDRDEWGVLPEMVEERDECLGMCLDGDDRFWVVSGYGTETQGRFRSDGECFDPATGSWSTIDNLWPFPSLSPKCNTSTVTLKSNNSGGKQCEWLWFLGNEQQQQFEYEDKERRWKMVSSIVKLPNSVIGTSSSSSCVSVTTLGDHQCNKQKKKQKVFVMSGNGGRGSLSSSPSLKCSECESEGGFIMERDTSNGNTKWHHVHTPVAFSGFPYSSSYLLI